MSGTAYDRRLCADCGAFLHRWTHSGVTLRWRCPWTLPRKPAPDEGDWLCGSPYRRDGQADQVRPYITAARPNISTV